MADRRQQGWRAQYMDQLRQGQQEADEMYDSLHKGAQDGDTEAVTPYVPKFAGLDYHPTKNVLPSGAVSPIDMSKVQYMPTSEEAPRQANVQTQAQNKRRNRRSNVVALSDVSKRKQRKYESRYPNAVDLRGTRVLPTHDDIMRQAQNIVLPTPTKPNVPNELSEEEMQRVNTHRPNTAYETAMQNQVRARGGRDYVAPEAPQPAHERTVMHLPDELTYGKLSPDEYNNIPEGAYWDADGMLNYNGKILTREEALKIIKETAAKRAKENAPKVDVARLKEQADKANEYDRQQLAEGYANAVNKPAQQQQTSQAPQGSSWGAARTGDAASQMYGPATPDEINDRKGANYFVDENGVEHYDGKPTDATGTTTATPRADYRTTVQGGSRTVTGQDLIRGNATVDDFMTSTGGPMDDYNAILNEKVVPMHASGQPAQALQQGQQTAPAQQTEGAQKPDLSKIDTKALNAEAAKGIKKPEQRDELGESERQRWKAKGFDYVPYRDDVEYPDGYFIDKEGREHYNGKPTDSTSPMNVERAWWPGMGKEKADAQKEAARQEDIKKMNPEYMASYLMSRGLDHDKAAALVAKDYNKLTDLERQLIDEAYEEVRQWKPENARRIKDEHMTKLTDEERKAQEEAYGHATQSKDYVDKEETYKVPGTLEERGGRTEEEMKIMRGETIGKAKNPETNFQIDGKNVVRADDGNIYTIGDKPVKLSDEDAKKYEGVDLPTAHLDREHNMLVVGPDKPAGKPADKPAEPAKTDEPKKEEEKKDEQPAQATTPAPASSSSSLADFYEAMNKSPQMTEEERNKRIRRERLTKNLAALGDMTRAMTNVASGAASGVHWGTPQPTLSEAAQAKYDKWWKDYNLRNENYIKGLQEARAKDAANAMEERKQNREDERMRLNWQKQEDAAKELESKQKAREEKTERDNKIAESQNELRKAQAERQAALAEFTDEQKEHYSEYLKCKEEEIKAREEMLKAQADYYNAKTDSERTLAQTRMMTARAQVDKCNAQAYGARKRGDASWYRATHPSTGSSGSKKKHKKGRSGGSGTGTKKNSTKTKRPAGGQKGHIGWAN